MYFFWPLVVTLLYVPVGLIWLAYRFLEYKTQLLLLTNKRLVLFKGIIKKKQYMIPLEMAAQMTIEQGFLGRKAGYGTLVAQMPFGDPTRVQLSGPSKDALTAWSMRGL